MGCCSDRLSSESYESLLIPFQEGLKLKEHRAMFIDRAVHRYSSNSRLYRNQFSYFLKSLNLKNASDLEKLLENPYFYNSDSHNSIKVSCLGILLGQGTVKEKALLFFQNYDLDLSKSLGEDEVRQMLEDIIIICNKILIEFTFEKISIRIKIY